MTSERVRVARINVASAQVDSASETMPHRCQQDPTPHPACGGAGAVWHLVLLGLIWRSGVRWPFEQPPSAWRFLDVFCLSFAPQPFCWRGIACFLLAASVRAAPQRSAE